MWALAASIADGSRTIIEVLANGRDRIAAYSERFGAFEHVADVAAQAERLHEEAGRGAMRGPLHGVPISVKDVIDVEGMPTTGSSRAMAPYVARADALAVGRLRAAGAVIVGKTVTHEFALGVTTPQSRNPWDESRVPGGSSGGSAISIVTGMAAASLGTDTRASIRVPAALTGVVGFKPTFGLVPVDHWLPLSWSMDHFAPMARSVRDIALMMDVLAEAGDRFRSGLRAGIEGMRMAVPDACTAGSETGVRTCFEATMAALSNAGAVVVATDAPDADDLALANAAGMVVSRIEAAHYHAASGTDVDRCSIDVRDQLRAAMEVDAVDYVRAMRLRGRLHERLLAAFGEADVLAMPTSKVVAPRRDEADQYLLVLSENCIPWSFAGFPAISLYAGRADGLPVGLQLVARPGDDARLLASAYAVERVLPTLPEWSAP